MLGQKIQVGDAAPDAMVLVAPHQIELGRGQDGDVDPDVGQPACDLGEIVGRHDGQLAHVADRDPAAHAVLFGQIAHQQAVEIVGRRPDVEMQVDREVVFARQLEDAADLPPIALAMPVFRACTRISSQPG